MSDVAEPSGDLLPTLVDQVPTEQPGKIATPAPQVLWGRATALQLVAGGIAGFIVPFSSVVLAPGFRVAEVGPWIAISLVSAVLVALFGAGIPLLVAWISWLAVSGSRRGLRREVLAVVFGAIVGSLIVLAFIAAFGDLWIYVATVLTLGGMPGVAFALWVAAAWRRERKAPAVASQ